MLDALVRYATEGIIVSDPQGKIKMANPIAEKQFGYEPNELLGKGIDLLVPDRFVHKHENHREGYVKNPHPRSMGIGMDLYAKRKDGTEFPVEISLSTFKTSEGMFVMSFIIDITERKAQQNKLNNANEEIKKLYGDLEKRVAERTEELARVVNELAESKQELMRSLNKEKDLNNLKSRFITTASHEFRTPLTGILSSIALISRYQESGDGEKVKNHVQKIRSSVNNLTGILNDFLSLSKLEEGVVRNNATAMNLEDFAKEVVEEMKVNAKAGQKINYRHKGAAEAGLDKQLMRNILINLLSNAFKYSPPGKEVEFSTECTGKAVIIRVTDHGIGIPEEDQVHLFERFFRANNATNIDGTGLGLNIVKKYLELMKGEITFKSQLRNT